MFDLKSTVMGPEKPNDSKVTHIHLRSRMEVYEDNMIWREDVMDWDITVQAYADEDDKKEKGTVAGLELTFYR